MEKTEKTAFQKWCGQPWLYVVYFLGIFMVGVLIWNWSAWAWSQRLICMLAIAVPLHVFEEDSFPGGFYFMNNTGFHSEQPMVYPQSECTNMITNLGAEILMILFTFLAMRMEVSVVSLVLFFGLGETVNHTRSGALMLRRYREKGKRTIYGPGTVTSWCILIPLSITSLRWLTLHSVRALQVVGGLGLTLGIMICLILIPFAVSIRTKSPKFAFEDKGYFEKYERE